MCRITHRTEFRSTKTETGLTGRDEKFLNWFPTPSFFFGSVRSPCLLATPHFWDFNVQEPRKNVFIKMRVFLHHESRFRYIDFYRREYLLLYMYQKPTKSRKVKVNGESNKIIIFIEWTDLFFIWGLIYRLKNILAEFLRKIYFYILSRGVLMDINVDWNRNLTQSLKIGNH